MGCNCATKEQIEELYRRYGDKKNVSKRTTKQKIQYYTTKIATVVCMIPISIGLLLFVLYKGLFDDDKRISVSKFLKLQEQNIEANVK